MVKFEQIFKGGEKGRIRFYGKSIPRGGNSYRKAPEAEWPECGPERDRAEQYRVRSTRDKESRSRRALWATVKSSIFTLRK